MLIGYSDSIVNPETANQIDNPKQLIDKKSWIELPKNPAMVADSEYSASKVIDGETGGIVELNINYVAKGSVNVIINASIEVPAGVYSGTKNIQMIIKSNNGSNRK